MTDPVMVVEFPPPTKPISMNGRYHWATKARLTADWKYAAKLNALAQLGHSPSRRRRPPCFVRFEFPVRDRRRRDPENLHPTSKACVDGMVAAGVWDDDDETHVLVLPCRFYVPTGRALVRIRLHPMTEGMPT